jgi:hypothetical protein
MMADSASHDQKVDVIMDALADTKWVFVWLEERGFAQVPTTIHICDLNDYSEIDHNPIPTVCKGSVSASEIAIPEWEYISSDMDVTNLEEYCDECVDWLLANKHRFPDYFIEIESNHEFCEATADPIDPTETLKFTYIGRNII